MPEPARASFLARLGRRSLAPWRHLVHWSRYGADLLTARPPDPSASILGDRPGLRPGSRRLCLFSHYDPEGRVAPHVVHYLEHLARMGVSVVFITTAPDPWPADLDVAARFSSRVIVRENVGLDFGSWHDALWLIGDLSNYDELILANDSVYGPLFDLEPIFRTMSAARYDVWGVTESLQEGHHLQSYFLVFGRRALRDPFFAAFWGDFRHLRYKPAVVGRFEIGLSRRARRAGLRLGAYCPYEPVRDAFLRNPHYRFRSRVLTPRCRLNPSHFFWQTLIEEFGCPFLKVGLVRDNPEHVPGANWEECLRRATSYDPNLIHAHLARFGRGEAMMPQQRAA